MGYFNSNILLNTFLFLTYFSLVGCNPDSKDSNLIFTNATIWTGAEDSQDAQAMVISGERILYAGSNEGAFKYSSTKARVIDLKGAFITPGFIDSHVHFLTGGFNLSSVQLRDADTPDKFINRIAEYCKTVEKGIWILGGDWDHELWGGELPQKEWIDSISLDHPIFITRLDGHMSLANSHAMKLAGIDKTTSDVEGGIIVRDQQGEPTGIFKDNAARLIFDIIPPYSEEQEDQALLRAMNYVASKGVTSVHHMAGYMDVLKRARESGSLTTRIYTMMPLKEWKSLNEMINREGKGDEWLRIGGLKGFVDGSLGSHTAAFFEPYADTPEERGIFINSEEDLQSWITKADSVGLQLLIHAIGDRAINFLLNTFESVQNINGERDRRFRIEHAQHIATEDISRFSELGVIPSMQPYHAIDDGRWAEKVIGPERIKTTYAFKSLWDAGANVAFGSDWFVAPPTPLEGIYAAVTRQTLDGANPEGWVPEQKINVEQALIAYTRNGAYASFEEDIKGTLEKGKLADFVILDRDLRKIDPSLIKEVKILETWVNGKVVFKGK